MTSKKLSKARIRKNRSRDVQVDRARVQGLSQCPESTRLAKQEERKRARKADKHQKNRVRPSGCNRTKAIPSQKQNRADKKRKTLVQSISISPSKHLPAVNYIEISRLSIRRKVLPYLVTTDKFLYELVWSFYQISPRNPLPTLKTCNLAEESIRLLYQACIAWIAVNRPQPCTSRPTPCRGWIPHPLTEDNRLAHVVTFPIDSGDKQTHGWVLFRRNLRVGFFLPLGVVCAWLLFWFLEICEWSFYLLVEYVGMRVGSYIDFL